MTDCTACAGAVGVTLATAKQNLIALSTQAATVQTGPIAFVNPITITGNGVSSGCSAGSDLTVAGGASVAKNIVLSNDLNGAGNLTVPNMTVGGNCNVAGQLTFVETQTSPPTAVNSISVPTANQLIQIGSVVLGLGGSGNLANFSNVTFPVPYTTAPIIMIQLWSGTDNNVSLFNFAAYAANISATGFTVASDLFNIKPSSIPDFEFINEFVVDWLAIGTITV